MNKDRHTHRLSLSLAVAAAVVAAGAARALAVDATGVWSGHSICRPRGGVAGTVRRDSMLLVTQRGEALFIEIDGAAYRGESHASRRKPTRAAGRAIRGDDASGVLEFRVSVDDARGTATLVAESTVRDTSDRWHCRYQFTRTSRTDPEVGHPAPPQGGLCGDGVVDDARGEECDGAATGTPCDGVCTGACTCPQACEPLDVTGHWEGTWSSEVTGETGPVVANLGQEAQFVFGPISFPPFRAATLSPPFIVMGRCVPAAFSTGALLGSGSVGTLDGIATNASLAGTWAISDQGDHGTWQVSR
jgi:hypothetical protein